MSSVLTAPPAIEPVSLAEAKAHLRISHSDEDQLIARLISSARRVVEARTGLLLISQQWTCFRDAWPEDGMISVPLAPLISVNDLLVYGEDDVAATIDTAHYYADLASRPPRLLLRGSRLWAPPGRVGNGIAINVTAGFGAASTSVPEPLRQAMLVLTAHWYEHRGPGELPPVPLTASALLSPYRELRV
jgi:uncharacterized phiE125 gp8 family phage protein